MSDLLPSRTGNPVFGFNGASYGAMASARPLWHVEGVATGSDTGDAVAETTQYVTTGGAVEPFHIFQNVGAAWYQVDTQNTNVKFVIMTGEFTADPSGWALFGYSATERGGVAQSAQFADNGSTRGQLNMMWTDSQFIVMQQSKTIGRTGSMRIYDAGTFVNREYPVIFTISNTPEEKKAMYDYRFGVKSALSKMAGFKSCYGKKCPFDEGSDGEFQIYPIYRGNKIIAYRVIDVKTGKSWVVPASAFEEWESAAKIESRANIKNLLLDESARSVQPRCEFCTERGCVIHKSGSSTDQVVPEFSKICPCGRRSDTFDNMCCEGCTGLGCVIHTLECHQRSENNAGGKESGEQPIKKG